MSQASPKKIGVLIESHFDETEFVRFNEVFPAHGLGVEYLSYLWGQPALSFKGNDLTQEVTVETCVSKVSPEDYAGVICIGGYAMDRLRYEEHPRPKAANRAPAVEFMRRAIRLMDAGALQVGAICHGLWLLCADPDLLRERQVTCAHNIICDVVNAGGQVVYDGDQTRDVHVDGGLVTGRHPGVVDRFLDLFIERMR